MRILKALKVCAVTTGALFGGLLLLGYSLSPAKQHPGRTYSYVTPEATYQNNYRAGSYSNDLVAPAVKLFPHLSIVLVGGKGDGNDLVPDSTGKRLVQAYPLMQRYGQQKLNDIGFAVNAMTVTEETFSKNNTCPVITTKRLDAMSLVLRQGVVVHEAIHCARFQVMQYNRDHLREQLTALVANVERGMDGGNMYEFMRAMDEGMVTAMLRSLSFEPGEIGEIAGAQFDREYQTAMAGDYTNETPALAKLMPEICPKQGDCPTEISALMTKLFADKRYIKAMQSDIKWLNKNADKWGRVSKEA